MLKYTDTQIVFREIPDKIALAINISNCPNHCIGCHSPELRKNIGIELSDDELDRLIKENDGINCVCFMGEGRDVNRLSQLITRVKDTHNITTALYTGSDEFDESVFNGKLDYLKIGHYDEKYGSLDKPTTNQRLYRIVDKHRVDITNLFWNGNIYVNTTE
jgi:anaerobic ribonucleoside-triphosphate reductase activating protein